MPSKAPLTQHRTTQGAGTLPQPLAEPFSSSYRTGSRGRTAPATARRASQIDWQDRRRTARDYNRLDRIQSDLTRKSNLIEKLPLRFSARYQWFNRATGRVGCAQVPSFAGYVQQPIPASIGRTCHAFPQDGRDRARGRVSLRETLIPQEAQRLSTRMAPKQCRFVSRRCRLSP